ncbi:MAG: DUF2157 domain-containing protein [Bacteroidetes bacterium]|nr:MAG: DUF2157 domain-containing protein [Bacteroidota bacterium]
MKHLERADIHTISTHGNLTEAGVERLLKENVYNNKTAWQSFLRLFFVALGVGFMAAGIVFFFAYNWASLHKFAKIGLILALMVTTVGLVLFLKSNINIRNTMLTGAAVLVGVLFAVFGQVYQTGANAYDFFLAWTIFITLWVVVSDFAPLWLLYLILINTTLYLYAEQVATDWPETMVFGLQFVINTSVLIALIWLGKHRKLVQAPPWFISVVTLACATFATLAICIGIFAKYAAIFPIIVCVTAIVYALGIGYALKLKSGFFLSVVAFSLIVMVSAVLVEISDGESMLLLVSLFIIASVTLVIRTLMGLQKKWKNAGS